VDTTPPTAITLDAYSQFTTSATYQFKGTKEPNTKVLLNGNLVINTNSNSTWSHTASLTPGVNTLSYTLQDQAGNTSEPAIAQITFDNTPPGAVAITVNPNGNGKELTLDWSGYNVAANGNDIAAYKVYLSTINYSSVSQMTPVRTLGSNTKWVTLTNLTRNQRYYLSVVAQDQSGLSIASVSPISAIPIDTKAPSGLANLVVIADLTNLSLSWRPATNEDSDLASYRINYNDNGQPKTITLNQADIGNSNPVTHQIWGLAPATAHDIRVSAVDSLGNTSAALTNQGVTLLANPQNQRAIALSESAEISWSPATPYALVKHYAIYASTQPFSSVVGMAPAQIVPKGSFNQSMLTSTLTGLTNGTRVYVAVTTVNNSDGEYKQVTPVSVTPVNDNDGPIISEALYISGSNSVDLTAAPVLDASGKLAIKATDISKLSRVVFTLNEEPLANLLITNPQGQYEYALDLTDMADGSYILDVAAYDMLENLTETSYPFTIDLAAPNAPTIVSPVAGKTVTQKTMTIAGKSAVNTKVSLSNNGVEVVNDISVDASGNYSANIDLQEGDNLLTAKSQYIGRTKWSAESAVRKVILNTQIPNAPTGMGASALKQGQILLSWNAVTSSNTNNQVKGYNLYRASSSFSDIADVGVTKVNSQLITATSFTDLLINDGSYFYAVSAVNQVGNAGGLSTVVTAVADSKGPSIVQLTYSTDGQYDVQTERYGQGRVQVTATFDEQLRNAPYFSIVPNQGLPISVELTKSFTDNKVYTGQFTIDVSTSSGMAYAVMSAHDNVGNRGTEIAEGTSLKIDTQGPEITNLVVAPAEPLKVDPVTGLLVNVSITLNDEFKNGTDARLVPQIDGIPVNGYDQGLLLVRTGVEPVFTGSFTLPNTTAESAMSTLSFSHSAEDDLGNITTKIYGQNQFQVYQGDLPPLDIPNDLMATAQPNGKVKLSWRSVEKAVSYVLYRQGPNDSELVALDPVAAIEFEDQTPIDGTYLYAIASVRSENGQQAESAKSETVSVKSDRVAPSVPQNIALELNGAGLVARWHAPAVDVQGAPQIQQGLTYNMYRVALPQGQQVVDLTGLTPIQTRIPALIALDTKPSIDEHSYFVTAIDVAGNESAPSATQYLNFGLLPVSKLHISLNENGYPQLTWEHKGTAIDSYRVYRRVGENEPLLLTPEPIDHTAITTTYVDTTYNNGEMSDGASQEVVYSVVAVDNNDVESLGHELTLPALSVHLDTANGILLKRGVMNQLLFHVDNKGITAATKVRLYVTLTENNQVREQHSDYFTVEAGANTVVPVVVGGYEKLDAITDLSLRIEQKPQENQRVIIDQSESVEVGTSSLTINLNTEEFVRGGSGKVSFTVTNTSDVETELVMATNNSKADSTEIRFILEDLQGNLLTKQAIRQTTGGVINVPSGQTVARIAPSETFTSDDITLNVPAAAPDQIKLRLVIDKYHYQLGKDTHVAISGIGVSKDVQLSDTPYYAEVTSIEPRIVSAKNGSVTISGKATNRLSAQPMANVPVTLAYVVRGFERKSTVYTDATGSYVFSYKPDGVAGKYRVSAIHPDMTDRPNHGEFIAEGGSVNPSDFDLKIPRNYTQKIPVQISAGFDTVLNNVRLVQLPSGGQEVAELPAGVSITYQPLTIVKANSSGYLTLNFSGDNSANETGVVSYRVEADNHTGINSLGNINIIYKLAEATPAVSTVPAYIDTGVALEQQVFEDIVIANKGLDLLRNTQVSLVSNNASPVPAWVYLSSTGALGDLAIGDSRVVQLTAKPDAAVTEGIYEFKLQITGDNLTAYTLPVFIKVTQSGRGNSFFKVSDIYTATLDANNQLVEGVSGARIQLQNENVLSEVYNLNTDAKGEALFENIPAGRYAFRASAFDHDSVSGRVWVKPGVTGSEKVFLMNNLINVEWSVREITIEDRYEIKLEATFKTHVPAALVVFDPMYVQLPVMKRGEVFQGEFTITNHGLIRADNVKQKLPANTDLVRFEFLKTVPTSLESGQVFTLPYRLIALRDFNPETEAEATGGGCGNFSASTAVAWTSDCAEGTTVPGNATGGWGANWGSCGGGAGTAAAVSYSQSHGGGSGGGSGWSGSGSAIGTGKKCDSEDPNDDSCDGGNGSGQ